ncbi:MAG: hypothetical protein ACKV2T_37360 [Kofleriaceae bacterium]
MTIRAAFALALMVPVAPAWADSDASVTASAEGSNDRDDWIAVDAPVIAVAENGGASVGVAPSISAFRDNGHGAIGARFRGGLLSNRVTDETRTTGTLGFVFRVGMPGPWVEVGGGAGKYGEHIGLSAELGVGYDFRLGTTTLSVSARYVHFDLDVSEDRMSADAALVGLGTYFGRAARSRSPRSTTVARAMVASPAPVSTSCSEH